MRVGQTLVQSPYSRQTAPEIRWLSRVCGVSGVPEGLEELGVRPARTFLGMPLHREHEAFSGQLQGLHYVVRRSGDNQKPARYLVHALMVA